MVPDPLITDAEMPVPTTGVPDVDLKHIQIDYPSGLGTFVLRSPRFCQTYMHVAALKAPAWQNTDPDVGLSTKRLTDGLAPSESFLGKWLPNLSLIREFASCSVFSL